MKNYFRFLLLAVAVCSMQFAFSQETELHAFDTTFYKIPKSKVLTEIAGDFFYYSPPNDGWYDPIDGTKGIIVKKDGFTLVGDFAQIVYPPTGSGNIDGTVTDKAHYYDGVWYKCVINNITFYLLNNFKRTIEVMNFSNGKFIGDSTLEYDRVSSNPIVFLLEPDGTWYYRNKMGKFPFKRTPDKTFAIDVANEKSLSESGLTPEDWVVGLWKAIVTKEDRVESISEYGLSQDEIDELLKSYGEEKTYYLEITKDYLRYQFPYSLIDDKENTFSTQHSYRIKESEGSWIGYYDICVDDKVMAHIGKYNKGILLSIDDGIECYDVALQRVTDLGVIEDGSVGNVVERSDNVSLDWDEIQPSDAENVEQDSTTGIVGYEWLEGEWGNSDKYGDWAKVVVTPTTYRAIRSGDNDITEGTVAISTEDNYIQDGKMLALDKDNPLIGIDESNHQIYMIFGEYHTMYLEKLKNELGRCWKNILWVYGEWKVPTDYHNIGQDSHVRITPFYYQTLKGNSDKVDFSLAQKERYKLMKVEHKLLGDVVCIDDLYLDTDEKRIYYVDGLDKKIYLEQTAEYTQIKVIFWIVAIILGIGILLGLYFLVRKLIRIIITNAKKVATWIKPKWDNIYPKTISTIKEVGSNTKEQWETNVKPKAKSTIKKVSSNAKEQWEDNVKPMASSAINRISEEIKSKTSDIKEKTEAFSSSESKLVKGALSSKSDSNNDSSFNWKKLIKVFKFAMLIASILGIADAIADESDDSAEIDIDGDGDIDGVAIDTDGDGDIDGVAFDSDGDGDIDGLAVDDNGDGQIDTISIDSNNDGAIDTIAADSNGDGSIDKVAYDTNGDGAFDEIEMDTDGDGVIDTAGIDTDGDGSIDTITESGNTNGYADGYSAEECYHNAQNRIIEIDRQIMNTPDPIQRAALMRERDLIMAQSPSPVEIIHNRMHR